MKKKVLLLLTLIAMLTVLFTISASAADPVKTWDISETANDSVTAYLYEDSNYEGYYLLKICGEGNYKKYSSSTRPPWFNSYRTKIKTVNIGDGVTRISTHSFCEFTALEKITVSKDITSIGSYAFSGCINLKEITIPENVVSIEKAAFLNCTGLIKVGFNATAMADLETGNNVFYNAGRNGNGITVTIGKNVTKIPARLFCPESAEREYYPKVTNVVFEENSQCTSIGVSAFNRCRELENISIPSTVINIGAWAFQDNYSLMTITIPKNVASIGKNAFSECQSLTEIKFNATSLADLETGNNVFYNAGKNGNGITVTIGKNVTKIPARLFCPDSYTITYSPKVTKVIFEDNSVCTSIGQSAFNQCSYLTSINIPNTVTTIGPWAFQNNYALESIRIPSSVTSIENYAFINCTALTEIIFEKESSLVSLGEDSFCNCTALKNVVLPRTLTTMYRGVFYNTALEKIVIPNTVTTMGKYVFECCDSLTIYAEATSKPSKWDNEWNSHNRPVVWDYKNTIKNDVFTFKGYSFNESGSMAYGYDIDYGAKVLYEELTGDILEIGVVFAGYDNLSGNQPLDANGQAVTISIGKVVKANINSYEYTYYDFILTDIDDSIKDVKFVISAYLYDGEAVKYVQENSLSNTVTGKSYNEAKESVAQ